jgi:hypothetical protein
VVSEDAGREDLRSLHLSNNELDRDTDCKAVVKYSLGTPKERVVNSGQMAQKPGSLFKAQSIGHKDK